MDPRAPSSLTIRERTSMVLFIASIFFIIVSIITNVAIGVSEPMMAVTFASFLFLLLPIIAIRSIRKRLPYPEYFFNSPDEGKKALNKYANNIRAMGIIFGLLMLLFTVGSAITAYEIYEPDIPGGILIAFSGLLSIGAAVFYKLELDPDLIFSNLPPPPHIHEKEIIREKEVIVKIRCQYCGFTFNEALDQCPTCGAKK